MATIKTTDGKPITLGTDCLVSAGARALIKRAARRFGAEDVNAWNAQTLAAWAYSRPELLAGGVARAFESAAQRWTDGNNSGNPRALEAGERDCDNQRAFAEMVLGLFNVTATYPGLYPVLRAGEIGVVEVYGCEEADVLRAMLIGKQHTGTVRRMTCCCCGSYAGRFYQWFNLDNGYGICRPCAMKHAQSYPESSIGREGINWANTTQWAKIDANA